MKADAIFRQPAARVAEIGDSCFRPRPWENVSAEAAGALYPAGVGAETPIDRLARVT